MPKRSRAGQLDLAIQSLLGAGPEFPSQELDPTLSGLLEIALDLRDLPRETFKASLRSDLERRSSMATQTKPAAIEPKAAPHIRLKGAAAAIEFYQKAFGAREIMRFAVRGHIAYAELAIGSSTIMLGEEAPGYPGPSSFGGSPVSIHISVADVDSFVEQAVAAGGKLVAPVTDQFYGDRSGAVADPFGYTWGISTRKEHLTVEEMHRRFEALGQEQPAKKPSVDPIPKGYHTITPYLVAQDAPALIDFAREVFGAEETFRAIGSAGGIHAEVRLGDSMLMVGGGGPELSWRGQSLPAALHVYVEDVDEVYGRAIRAGAETIQAPANMPYGERAGSVKDAHGNHWYIATWKGKSHVQEGLRTVTAYLHPLRAEPVIDFLKRGLGAEELMRHATPDGVIHHAKIKIGDSVLEMGEAHGPYQPMPGMFYLYLPDVDAVYRRALNAGATSMSEPADQSYGDRTAGVKDVFGNQWYLATHIRD